MWALDLFSPENGLEKDEPTWFCSFSLLLFPFFFLSVSFLQNQIFHWEGEKFSFRFCLKIIQGRSLLTIFYNSRQTTFVLLWEPSLNWAPYGSLGTSAVTGGFSFSEWLSCLGITDREHVSSFHWNNTLLLWLGRKQQCKAQFCKGWIFLEVFVLPPDLSLVFQQENHFCKLNFPLSCSSAHCSFAFPTAAATSFCVFSCNPHFTLSLVTHFATCQSSLSDFLIRKSSSA